MKKRRAKIKIEKIMDEIMAREEIGGDLFPVFPAAEDYINPCLIMCNGMTVHEVFVDARIGNRLR